MNRPTLKLRASALAVLLLALGGAAGADPVAGAAARPVWGGKANMDEFEADSPTGPIQGLTLRLYDPKARQWSIYWATWETNWATDGTRVH